MPLQPSLVAFLSASVQPWRGSGYPCSLFAQEVATIVHLPYACSHLSNLSTTMPSYFVLVFPSASPICNHALYTASNVHKLRTNAQINYADQSTRTPAQARSWPDTTCPDAQRKRQGQNCRHVSQPSRFQILYTGPASVQG